MKKIIIFIFISCVFITFLYYIGNTNRHDKKLYGGWSGEYLSDFLCVNIAHLYFSNDSVAITRFNSIQSTHKYIIRNNEILIYSDSLPVSLGKYYFENNERYLRFKDMNSYFFRDSAHYPYPFQYINIPLGAITHANQVDYTPPYHYQLHDAPYTLTLHLTEGTPLVSFQLYPNSKKFNIDALPAILRDGGPINRVLIHAGAGIEMKDIAQTYLCLYGVGFKKDIKWVLGKVDNERYYIFNDKSSQFWKEDIEKSVCVLSQSSELSPVRSQALQSVNTILKIETEKDIKSLSSLKYDQKYLISYSSKMRFSDYINAQTELQKMSGKSVISEIRLE